MQKKNTTKRVPRATQDRAALRKELAEHVSAILRNPETPVDLYNAIAEQISTWSSDGALNAAPAFIELCLDYHHRAEDQERAKGGAR